MIAGILLGFLCGSLMPGYWIGKFCFGKDLQFEGSGNIGATNAYRVLGPASGTLILGLDVVKGAAAVWISRRVGGVDALSGLAAILGHTFTPFLKFRGGKGVATGLGVFLNLAFKPMLAAVAAFVVVLLISRRVSASSCLASIVLGVGVPLAMPAQHRDLLLISITELTVLLVLIRHRNNILRLWRGEEPKLF